MFVVLPDARAAFVDEFDVPRGTMEKLDRYVALLTEWQRRFNLVGPSTLPVVWDRHIRDSAQLLALPPSEYRAKAWLDIGSGAGFPGLVLAALGVSRVHLVESIAKKAGFLEAVSEALELTAVVSVENCRIESLPAFPAGVITARACASLTQLFDWGLRFAARSTIWLLPKGASVADELVEAGRRFRFQHELVPSLTDERGRIVVAKGVTRR
jgi:16S rRNA (guanine527-N7)-methyltransferase